ALPFSGRTTRHHRLPVPPRAGGSVRRAGARHGRRRPERPRPVRLRDGRPADGGHPHPRDPGGRGRRRGRRRRADGNGGHPRVLGRAEELAAGRHPRRAHAERQGPGLGLHGRRARRGVQRRPERPLALHDLGPGHGDVHGHDPAAPVERHGLQHLLRRPRPPQRRDRLPGGRQPLADVRRHRRDAHVQPHGPHLRPLGARGDHADGAVVPDRDRDAQRRAAHHGRPARGLARHAGGPPDRRQDPAADGRAADPVRLAARGVPVDGRGAGRPRLRLGSRRGHALPRHPRHRLLGRQRRHPPGRRPRLRQPRDVRRRQGHPLRRRPSRGGDRVRRGHHGRPQPEGGRHGLHGQQAPPAQPDGPGRRQRPRHGRPLVGRGAGRRAQRGLRGGAVEPRHGALADAGRHADPAPVPLRGAAPAGRPCALRRRRRLLRLQAAGLRGQERGGLHASVPLQEGRLRRARPAPADRRGPVHGDLRRADRDRLAAGGVHPQGRAHPARRGDALGEHEPAVRPAEPHDRGRHRHGRRARQREHRAPGPVHARGGRRGGRPVRGEDGHRVHGRRAEGRPDPAARRRGRRSRHGDPRRLRLGVRRLDRPGGVLRRRDEARGGHLRPLHPHVERDPGGDAHRHRAGDGRPRRREPDGARVVHRGSGIDHAAAGSADGGPRPAAAGAPARGAPAARGRRAAARTLGPPRPRAARAVRDHPRDHRAGEGLVRPGVPRHAAPRDALGPAARAGRLLAHPGRHQDPPGRRERVDPEPGPPHAAAPAGGDDRPGRHEALHRAPDLHAAGPL
ncbi:MAG: hypothetical protein AVDCRST_MAG13-3838, partial [uncultured Solirubrobacteraceae bacterium]